MVVTLRNTHRSAKIRARAPRGLTSECKVLWLGDLRFGVKNGGNDQTNESRVRERERNAED